MKRTKPLGRKNYGSIPHLLSSKLGPGDHHIHEGQDKILTQKARKGDEVLVFEKYDGSNCGVARVNGEIIALTRSGYLAKESEFEHYHDFDKWVQNNHSYFKFLEEGERVVGEWLGKVCSIEYIYQEPFIAFDYMLSNNERLSWLNASFILELNHIQTARQLHQGGAINPSNLIDELNKLEDCMYHPAYAKSEKPEGLVYRVERNGKVDFLAKWVRHDFVAGKYLDKRI